MQLPNFIKDVHTRMQYIRKRQLYRNLVFKGGGIRGIAYLGALDVLDELGVVKNIRRLAGTSAGAIAATILSFRLSVKESKEIFLSLDFTKIPQAVPDHRNLPFWRTKREICMRRFFRDYGYYSSQYFHEWLQSIIADQCNGNGRATFADFQELGFRDLFIVASNMSRHRSEVFSYETTPDVAIADAVRMSMSIPLFFEALRFDGQHFGRGDYYLDGGLYNNFPMNIFDHSRYINRAWVFRNGINWATLGLFLYPEKFGAQDHPEDPRNVWEFATMAFRNLYYAQQTANFETSTVNQYRSIEISDRGITPTEFYIRPGSEKYNLLYQSGLQAARTFFGIESRLKNNPGK